MMLGGRLRLKASVDLARYDAWPHAKRIMASMQTYGLICADNGGHGMIQGMNDIRWGTYDQALRQEYSSAFAATPMTDFEVIEHGWTPTAYWYATLGDSKTEGESWIATLGYALRDAYAEPWQTSIYAAGSTTLAWAVANLTTLLVQIPAGADGANLRVLVNWGVNEMAVLPLQATWIADYQTLIDAIVAKQPAAKVFCVKPWYQGQDANANTMAGWVDQVVASRPNVAYVGHDERVWLRGTDNGVTMTLDGVHYSAAGQTECVAQWLALITGVDTEPEYEQFVYPIADAGDGNWLNQAASAVNLYNSLNESPSYDDSDYIQSGAAPVNDEVLLTMGPMNVPTPSQSCAILARVKLG